jgi:hypothetical protein
VRRNEPKRCANSGHCRHSPNGPYGIFDRGLPRQSGLMFAARITLPHFSISLAMSLAKVGGRAGEHHTAQFGKPRRTT